MHKMHLHNSQQMWKLCQALQYSSRRELKSIGQTWYKHQRWSWKPGGILAGLSALLQKEQRISLIICMHPDATHGFQLGGLETPFNCCSTLAWGHILQSPPARRDIIEEDKNTFIFLSSHCSFVTSPVIARRPSQLPFSGFPGAFSGSGAQELSSDSRFWTDLFVRVSKCVQWASSIPNSPLLSPVK